MIFLQDVHPVLHAPVAQRSNNASCYFAGALATELSHGTPFNAIMPMTLIWISAFLRDKTTFLPTTVE